MFHALANDKIDTGNLRFEHVLRDIQTLNEWVREGRLDSTAISVHAYAYVADKYAVLSHGASIGDGYGPMLVAKKPLQKKDLERATIAVPGKLTSAYLALRLYLDHFQEMVMPFDQIIAAVRNDQVDVGLLIHEGQLTHPGEGLMLIEDLGIWWQRETGLPCRWASMRSGATWGRK
jgi:1,4-dihydroxy-6-naphthoate synthase